MTEEVNNPLGEHIVYLQYSLDAINDMINMMNKPLLTPVMGWANLITNIQEQCGPQIDEINKKVKEKDEQPAG